MVRIVSKLFPLRFQIWHTVFHTDFVFVRKYKFVESLVGLKGVNRHVKTNTQTFIKFTLRHYRSRGRHCRNAALPDQNSDTAAPTDNFESQFKISEQKLRLEKFLSLL